MPVWPLQQMLEVNVTICLSLHSDVFIFILSVFSVQNVIFNIML